MSGPPSQPLQAQIRIGISGWTYPPWRGTFYPKGLAQKNELMFASRAFPSIEINGTFYGLQLPKSFGAWYDQTPEWFIFSLKAPRLITHIRRLREVQTPIANFIMSGLLRLNEKLGPILWQFPPSMKFDPRLFQAFLEFLPRSTAEATKLLSHCDLPRDRIWAAIDHDRPLRHAVEIRNESFVVDGFLRMLQEHNVALVVADTAGKWPMLHDLTADFVYARLHGDEELYVSGYTNAALDEWATKIRAWSRGDEAPTGTRLGIPSRKLPMRDVYAYFDNDVKVRSPFDAGTLAFKLGLRERPLEEADLSQVTEEPRLHWPPIKRPTKPK